PYFEQSGWTDLYFQVGPAGIFTQPATGAGAYSAQLPSPVMRCPAHLILDHPGFGGVNFVKNGVIQRTKPGLLVSFPDGQYNALISYAFNNGPKLDQQSVLPKAIDGIIYDNSRVKLIDITDGTTTTILAGERSFIDPNMQALV